MLGAGFIYDVLTLFLALILLAVMCFPVFSGVYTAVRWIKHKKLSKAWLTALLCCLPLSVFVAMDTYILPEVSNPKIPDECLEAIIAVDWSDEELLAENGFVSDGEGYIFENSGYTVQIKSGNGFSKYAFIREYKEIEYRALTIRNPVLSIDRWIGEAEYGYINTYEFCVDGITVSFIEEIDSKKDSAFTGFIENIRK